MNAQQIAKKLYDKGFDVEVVDSFVTVSLNRPVNTMEVEIALDFEVEILGRLGSSVVVMGS